MNNEPVATLIQIIADRDAEIKKLLTMIEDLHTPVTEFYKKSGYWLIKKEQLEALVEKAGWDELAFKKRVKSK
jgi:hypothetical protein